MSRRIFIPGLVRVSAGGGGSFSEGDQVTFTGSGFGTGPTSYNLTNTIHNTAVGVDIVLPSPFSRPTIATDDHQGYNDNTRSRCIRCPFVSEVTFDMAIQCDMQSNVGANDFAYFHWLTKAQTLGGSFPTEVDDSGGTTAPGGADDWQWKHARFRYNANDVLDSGAQGDSYIAHWDNSDGSFIETFTAFHYINGQSPSPFVNNVSGRRAGGDDLPTAYTQEWYQCEWFWSMGSGATGRVFLYVTRQNGTRNLVGSLANVDLLAAGRAFRYFYIQNYFGNDASGTGALFNGSWTAIDDLHCSRGNFKRVYLTDAPTLAASTFREIQPHSSWSDSQIIIPNLNAGASRSGSLYLHCVDTDATTRNDTSLANMAITVV